MTIQLFDPVGEVESGDYDAEEAAKGAKAAHDLPRLLEGKY